MTSEAFTLLKDVLSEPRGPKGGDLANPLQNPERRQATFNGVELEQGIRGLHHFEDTATGGLKNEQPWHAMAMELMLVGKTNVEIARLASVTSQQIATLKAQRWFQEKLALRMAETKASFEGLIKAQVQESIQMMADIRDDVLTTKGLKVKICQAFMEQGCGKPTQKVLSISAHTSFSSASEEMESIKQELEALRQAEESSHSSAVTLPPDQPSENG